MSKTRARSDSSDRSQERSPLSKKNKLEGVEQSKMSGRGRGRRVSNERSSDSSIRDVLDALEGLKNDLTVRLDSLEKKLEKVEETSKKEKLLETKLTKLERSNRLMEVEEKKRWVVIRGLWKQPDATRFETRKQLSDSINDLKVLMGVKSGLMDYYRLKDLTKGNNTYLGLVKIKFVTTDDKDYFFSRLPDVGRNKDLQGVSFQQDIPSFLVDKFKVLDGAAFKLRQEKKVKTRVLVRNLDLILQQRATVTDRWLTVEVETVGEE